MKKTRFLAALFFAAEMTAHFARGQDLVVDGGTTNITSGTNSFVNTFVGRTTDGNQLNVSESGTVLTNSGFFYVGQFGSSNNMVVSNRGNVVAVIASAVGRESSFNRLVVDGSNSTVTITRDLLDVGFGQLSSANSNSLVITNGGQVYIGGGGSSIGSFNARGNSVLVTGPGSALSNVDIYYVGFEGTDGQLTVSNQASFTTDNLTVGNAGDSNRVVIADGGNVLVRSNLVISALAGASNNSVSIGSGQLTVTNGTLNVGRLGQGTLNVSGGTVGVLNLVATNGADSVINFTGGTIISRGTTISNAVDFLIGGTSGSGAEFVAQGGTHSFSTNLFVGNSGSSNSLVITNNGAVRVGADLLISALAGASDNSVSISSGQLTVTNGTLNVGAGGLGTLNVSGGTVSVSNLFATNGANSVINLAGGTIISRGTTISNAANFLIGGTSGSGAEFVAQGGTHSFGRDIYVGDSGDSNRLVVSDGGAVNASFIGVGFGSSANHNVVIVESNSTITTTGFFDVGHNGSSNSLIITNGGKVYISTNGPAGLGSSIGSFAAFSNSVLVTGPGSTLSNAGNFNVGFQGSSNRLTLSNQGRFITDSLTVGNQDAGVSRSGSSNAVFVHDATLTVNTNLIVGGQGDFNSMTVNSGGTVTAAVGFIGSATTSSNNSVLVTGTNANGDASTWTNSGNLFVGNDGSSNSLVISNGGRVANSNGIIGWVTTSSNNSVLVTSNSLWTNSGNLYVGWDGSGNSLVISNGGRVANSNGIIGLATNSSNNSVLVAGTNSNGDRSTWTNSDALVVGVEGAGNGLVISNGGSVVNMFGFIGEGTNSSNNFAVVTGADSTWANSDDFSVGYRGSGNSLVISNGGEVASTEGYIGWSDTSSSNSVMVTDGGTWTNSGNLYVGNFGSSNSLVISNGGKVANGVGYIGRDLIASNNSVLVTGAGSIWTNSGELYVGFGSSGNSLTIAEGGTLAASNIIIASQPGSSGTLNIGRFGANGAASTINAPTIAFGAGTGVINFNQSNTVTVSSVISGNGAINQLGTGRSILSGANTYTGPTTVSAGTLVAQSQTALGTGAVSLLGGTLELQSQLDIGSLLWDGAATIRIADPGAGHFVNLGTNSLTLSNGLNNFDLTGAVFPNTPVKLMTSTNMSTFSTNDFGVVGANRYRLLIQGDTLYISTLPASYQPFAVTPNQREVAQALDNFIGAGGDRGTVSAALDGLSASQYPAAFEQMMPSQYASLPSMAFNVVNALNSSLFQRLWVIRVNGGGFNASGMNLAPMQAEMGGTDDMGVFAINPSKDTKWSSFVDGNGVFANASGTGSVQNYRSQSGGVSTGAAYSWTDAFATGVYVGYQGLQAEYDSGKTIDNAVRFGVFGTYDIEDFYFNALVGGAYHGYTVNRYINFGGLDRTATGRPGAGEFNLALGTGYDFQAGDLTFGPFTTLQYTYLGVQGFTETGADALNLDVSPYDSSSLLYTLGAQAAYNWRLSDKVFVTPMVFAGWQHEFLQNGYTINSSFATGGPAAPFNYNTSSPARDNFYGGAGVTVGIGERWQATFIYSAFAANENNSSQNLYLGVGYKF